MTTAAAAIVRDYELGDIEEIGAVATDIIYEGSAVGLSSASGRPLVAGDIFLGFAETTVDNSAGAAGAKRIRLRVRGQVVLPVTSVANTDIGKAVYASDDNAFVLTRGSNSYIGRVARFVSSGVAVVAFDAHRGGAAAITELTDSSGGTPSDTIPAQTGSYVEATQETTVASLAAKINEIIRFLR